MANENLIVFPNGRRLSEFVLNRTSGTAGSLAGWTNSTTLEAVSGAGVVYSMNGADLSQVGYIEGASGQVGGLRLYAFDENSPAVSVLSSKFRIGYDCHIGSNSGFLRDNAGTVEMHLTSGKKFSIIWG